MYFPKRTPKWPVNIWRGTISPMKLKKKLKPLWPLLVSPDGKMEKSDNSKYGGKHTKNATTLERVCRRCVNPMTCGLLLLYTLSHVSTGAHAQGQSQQQHVKSTWMSDSRRIDKCKHTTQQFKCTKELFNFYAFISKKAGCQMTWVVG